MIELRKVTKVYPSGVEALVDVNLHIGKDEFIFVVGPSGSGKTTLLKLLYREELATAGEVIVDKINVSDLRRRDIPYLRRNIGVVFQDYKLLPKRTVQENVAFALWVTGASRSEIRRKTGLVLELVGLTKKAGAFPAELSGGEAQRVCIARSIVNSPLLLLADEPTGNLDPATAWEIMELLDKINRRGTTVVVATHEKGNVDRMKKRVVAIEFGRVVRDEQLGSYSSVQS
jgi:cell division transport system ATP-binding protein